ncbi:MAG TPA: hypothetical protein PLJ38_11090 [bacterium]|nr:hypothetical protein [bacterium]
MKKYNIKIDEHTFIVDVDQTTPDTLKIKVNNNLYSVTIEEIIQMIDLPEEPKKIFVPVPTQTEFTTVSEDVKFMRSPMAGAVIDVKINQGQEIKNGDLVCIIEAMKMETELYSSLTGKIKNVFVKKGDNLKLNQKIFEIE